MLEFTTANAATLMPYMGIGTDITADPVCSSLFTDLGVAAPETKATWGRRCAEVIIE